MALFRVKLSLIESESVCGKSIILSCPIPQKNGNTIISKVEKS
jgi:hypothetical protein